MLWIDKYKPRKPEDLVVGSMPQYTALVAWYKAKKKMLAIISGPIGIGKTVIVDVLVSDLGMRNVLRVNAVGRKIKKVLEEITHAFDSRTVEAYYTGKMQKSKPNLIIIDEVDTVCNGSTDGSLAKIVTFAKTTKVPIICTANDTSLKTLKPLVDAAAHIRLTKPACGAIATRLAYILQAESRGKMSLEDLRDICTSCGNDVRQCIMELEFATKSAGALTYIKDNVKLDREMAPFDYLQHVFTRKPNLEVISKSEGEDLVPMLVEENIVRTSSKDLNKIANAFDCISLGDSLNQRIPRPINTALTVFGPAITLSSALSSRAEFPVSMGKASTISSHWRTMTDLTRRIDPRLGKTTLSTQLLHYLKTSKDSRLTREDYSV